MQFWLLPGNCVVCKRSSGRQRDLCPGCESALPRLRQPCLRCGLPLAAAVRQAICGACLLAPPPFACCVAPFAWAAPVDGLVAGFKYHARLQNGRVLAPLLAEAIRERYGLPIRPDGADGPALPRQGSKPAPAPSLPERLLPVPLHPARLRERGYNQSAELGRDLSRALGLPLDTGSLVRTRPTPPQRGLSAPERRRNLRGAFALRSPAALAGVRRVALLDDVVTTMSTARELAGLLQRAGVEEVHLWALARA